MTVISIEYNFKASKQFYWVDPFQTSIKSSTPDPRLFLQDGEIELLCSPHVAPGAIKEKHGTWRSGCNSGLSSKWSLNPWGPTIEDELATFSCWKKFLGQCSATYGDVQFAHLPSAPVSAWTGLAPTKRYLASRHPLRCKVLSNPDCPLGQTKPRKRPVLVEVQNR